MDGIWKGFYKFNNEKIQKITGFERTYFEIIITNFDGMNFEGEVKDDEATGGMSEMGKIKGSIVGDNITFEKLMPVKYVLNAKGIVKNKNKKHSTIYYSGKISSDKKASVNGNLKGNLFFYLGLYLYK